MKEQRFNLCDEKWIKVILLNGTETELSIRDVFRRAHEILTLSGETDLQNTAVLRFLIAFNVTILYRYDVHGSEYPFEDANQAITRFGKVWERGYFPEKMFASYIDRWHDRFYLIGGERPFYQVPEKYAEKLEVKVDKENPTGIQYRLYYDNEAGEKVISEKGDAKFRSASVINGEVLKSANKPSPFSNKAMAYPYEEDISKEKLSMPEAARWLIYYMTFADCSLKGPSPKTTFASAGANIHPVGENLFETLMLCSSMLDLNKNLYTVSIEQGKQERGVLPAWENEEVTEILSQPYGEGFPNNLPELYTQQSRKIILFDKDNAILGAYIAAGDAYGAVNAFIEPMFSFYEKKSKSEFYPYKIDITLKKSGVFGWNEFKEIFIDGKENPAPSRWIRYLFDMDILPDEKNIPFHVTGIYYGSSNCRVVGAYCSGISVNKKFFIDSREMDNVKDEINCINELSQELRELGKNIDRIQGQKKDEDKKQNKDKNSDKKYPVCVKICDMFEKRMNEEFRKYLAAKLTRDELKKLEFKIAYQVADNVLKDIGMAGYYGHGEMSVGVAENKFRAKISEIKKERGMLRESEENENAG